MATTYPHLCELVEDSSAGLRGIGKKRMFGCDAYFAGDAIYSVIWKTGRIGLKLPDPAAYAELLAMEGAEPWTAGTMKMSGWVLTPEAFHDDAEALTPWVRKAYQQNLDRKAAPTKAAKTGARTASAKATAAAKTGAKVASAKNVAKAASAKPAVKAAAKTGAKAAPSKPAAKPAGKNVAKAASSKPTAKNVAKAAPARKSGRAGARA